MQAMQSGIEPDCIKVADKNGRRLGWTWNTVNGDAELSDVPDPEMFPLHIQKNVLSSSQAAEEEARKKAAEEEAQKKAAEEEVRKNAQKQAAEEEEARKKAAEEDAQKDTAEKGSRKKKGKGAGKNAAEEEEHMDFDLYGDDSGGDN